MNDKTRVAEPGLGHYLQGVQHFGITVYDMEKSMEFYTEVLGGKLAVKGDGFIGEVLHNTLFQADELEAQVRRGVNAKTLGVPDVRDGTKEALDVRFISFGNTVVELLHFREAALTPNALNWGIIMPSGVGNANTPHLSFHVKDDIDLNQFSKQLEEESRRRGIDIVCNRIIHVDSEEERRKVALKYCANKMWNDSDYFVDGYSDAEFGDFHGWSLFYCKGPNNEQLEFNQVTRSIRQSFIKAQRAYNEANGTDYVWPGATKEEK
jgi:catechol 2,3-dioxygenase-like lactoylglutathione lyase family enzyme